MVAFDEVCGIGQPFEIKNGIPTGGVYSGTGVSGGYFDPSVAGPGIHTITYDDTSPNGCVVSTSADIEITASTIEVVGAVKIRKEADPEWFDSISEKYNQVVHEGKDALIQLDLPKVGKLMNKNNELLQELTVSCEELDNLVKVARENGAIGAKMTGTGRGGNMIALAPDEATAKQIADALEKARAAGVWLTSFGL